MVGFSILDTYGKIFTMRLKGFMDSVEGEEVARQGNCNREWTQIATRLKKAGSSRCDDRARAQSQTIEKSARFAVCAIPGPIGINSRPVAVPCATHWIFRIGFAQVVDFHVYFR
jgi:hypothetical protein